MKTLFYSALMALSVSALAETSTRNFSCMPSGQTGFFLKGSITIETEILGDEIIDIVSSKIKVEEFFFMTNGVEGSSVAPFEASTKSNQNQNGRLEAKFKKTTSARIKNINLVITEATEGQNDTVLKTSKGNKYSSGCLYNGPSGI